jgi:amidohydrolase
MPVLPQIQSFHQEMKALRHDLHAHPELGFEERRTSDLVAKALSDLGLDVHRGLARTGVVGTLRVGEGPAIGLRAEMDALPIEEQNAFGHRSQTPGCMHACGHDGHSTMLLGAARYLASTRNFSGAVHFIFQPAEEGLAGAQAMIDDGLFEKFPVEAVHAIHNNPLQKAGTFQIRSGPMMAASANFDIVIRGRGGHSGRPENGTDAIVASGALITSLQTIVSRNVSPHDVAVVSVTKIHAGTAYNIIPAEVRLSGNIRSYRQEVSEIIETAIGRIANGVSVQFGTEVDVKFFRGYPPLVNHMREATIAADIAAEIVGEDSVDRNGTMFMASEDFSYMLRVRPGAYMIIGNGEAAAEVHTPTYDFNDDLLSIGASYFARLVERTLPVT